MTIESVRQDVRHATRTLAAHRGFTVAAAIGAFSGPLHGGAPVTPDCPTRHTIVLRFFGDKLYYRPLPTTAPNFPYDIREFDDRSLTPGEPFRSPYFAQLR